MTEPACDTLCETYAPAATCRQVDFMMIWDNEWAEGCTCTDGTVQDGNMGDFSSARSSKPSCKAGPIGSVCEDGAIYIGTVGSNRIYARPSDSGVNIPFSNGYADVPQSETDGLSNTNALVSSPPGGYSYQAAQLCRTHGADWYLPAKEELNLFWLNRNALNLPSIGIETNSVDTGGDDVPWENMYWSSTRYHYTGSVAPAGWVTNGYAWNQSLGDGEFYGLIKTEGQRVRCVRR